MNFLSYYRLKAPHILVYMLQQVEYQPKLFLRWLLRYPDLNRVMARQTLVKTRKAKMLLVLAYMTWVASLAAAAWSVVDGLYPIAVIIFVGTPFVVAGVLATVALLARLVVVNPAERKEITRAKAQLESMDVTVIAILGSYGKTTMKQLLETVLREGKRVAATPGNKNVLISQARWINRLQGDEEVLIIEYGEAYPGDVGKMAAFTQPDIAVITGLAPAHLDEYGSLDAVMADFSDVVHYVGDNLYTNGESFELSDRVHKSIAYTINGVGEWKVDDIKSSISGTEFTLNHKKQKLSLQTSLLGLHQIGPLCAIAAIAKQLGLSDKQIEQGVSHTQPYEHRMQPYKMAGAWIIDDTYNGNIEGAKAGLRFLNELTADGNKIYVTPGFVEQGDMKQQVHEELGRAIAAAHPDKVVLMQNSTTSYIQNGLREAGFDGELLIEGKPLEFYTNLEHFVAQGDIVLMQNDWTDNYS
ncbi:MAG: Mur ligase family protein [Candidatus Saccharibacteria bacterium]|nr:Mur ligase family protein [Candidatus Saccharibacteria bacterium]